MYSTRQLLFYPTQGCSVLEQPFHGTASSDTHMATVGHFKFPGIDEVLTRLLGAEKGQKVTRFADVFLSRTLALDGHWLKLRRSTSGQELILKLKTNETKEGIVFQAQSLASLDDVASFVERPEPPEDLHEPFLILGITRVEIVLPKGGRMWIDSACELQGNESVELFLDDSDPAASTFCGKYFLSAGCKYTSIAQSEECRQYAEESGFRPLTTVASKALVFCNEGLAEANTHHIMLCARETDFRRMDPLRTKFRIDICASTGDWVRAWWRALRMDAGKTASQELEFADKLLSIGSPAKLLSLHPADMLEAFRNKYPGHALSSQDRMVMGAVLVLLRLHESDFYLGDQNAADKLNRVAAEEVLVRLRMCGVTDFMQKVGDRLGAVKNEENLTLLEVAQMQWAATHSLADLFHTWQTGRKGEGEPMLCIL